MSPTRPALAIRPDQPPSNLSSYDPSSESSTSDGATSSQGRLSSFQKLRQTFSYAGRKKSSASTSTFTPAPSTHSTALYQAANGDSSGADGHADPYSALRAATPTQGWVIPEDLLGENAQGELDADGDQEYEWERETDVGDGEGDGDGEDDGQGGRRGSDSAGDLWNQNTGYDTFQLHSPIYETDSGSFPRLPSLAINTPPLPQPNHPTLSPEESYALLLTFQSSSNPPSAQQSSIGHSHNPSHSHSVAAASQSTHDVRGRPISGETEWHELVDPGLVASLSREERKRQGLWWELIKGEKEYVGDMGTMVQGLIEPLRHHEPPLLEPESRLRAFIVEVFSSSQGIYSAHAGLLEALLDRQRNEWPLLSSATDLFLGTMLDVASVYETYMKNYPFADARVRREKSKNTRFRSFINERTTLQLTRRRDVSVFLSRPVTRLPRLLLLLEQILKYTPADHPDREELPTLIQIVTEAVKSSQPGIESAEAKIKLWNVAERLLFRRGEIIELDMAQPKRSLVYSGYVFRRVKSDTAWHGWQDVHAFLLDNYFLLTRDEEHGRHVVVSRPIPLDFLTILASDAPPERRSDFTAPWRAHSHSHSHSGEPQSSRTGERSMYPFTISTSSRGGGRTYTLCAGTDAGRQAWIERIESTKTLRQFDVDSNRIFTIHSLSTPNTEAILGAETFEWLGRPAVAIATPRSVWIGWRRDSGTFRELVRLGVDLISSLTVIPDFGWLLVLSSGRLYAFNLQDMMPTHDTATWVMLGAKQGRALGDVEKSIAFVRIGYTKGRLLVVYASHSKTTHYTHLTFEEPLVSSASLSHQDAFRRFATLTLPGYATELSFFRQTVAVVMEKLFIVAEPGNPTYHSIPNFSEGNNARDGEIIARMVSAPSAKALGMYQIGENEFLLVWDWGACFVTKYGEIARQGNYLRWNLTPSYCAFRPPQHVLLYDESGGRAEVRDVVSGRMCEALDTPGFKPVHSVRVDGDVLGLTPAGLVQIVETVEL